jgi:hypothetical protein
MPKPQRFPFTSQKIGGGNFYGYFSTANRTSRFAKFNKVKSKMTRATAMRSNTPAQFLVSEARSPMVKDGREMSRLRNAMFWDSKEGQLHAKTAHYL